MPVAPSGFAVCVKTFITPHPPSSTANPPNFGGKKKKRQCVGALQSQQRRQTEDGLMDNATGITITTLKSRLEL